MVRRCRLPAGLDVQLISSKPRLVQMRRTGPRGAPQSTRTVAVAMRALIDTAQILLLASSERALNIRYFERAPVQNTSFRCRKRQSGVRVHRANDHGRLLERRAERVAARRADSPQIAPPCARRR